MPIDDFLKDGIQSKIMDMKWGEVGYTLPCALSFDAEKHPYLNVGMPISPVHTPLNAMTVIKYGPGCADYVVDIGRIDYAWHLEKIVDGANPDLVKLERKIEIPSGKIINDYS